MAHLRTQIRAAVVATLAANVPTVEGRCQDSRTYPLETADVPALIVFTPSETSVPTEIVSPTAMDRRVQVAVRGYAKATASDALAALLDQIALEVEVALADPCPALRGIAKGINLTGTLTEETGAAEKLAGRITLTFEVYYIAAVNAPDVSL